MTDDPSGKDLLDKRDDVVFCLDMLEEQAQRLGLPEVQALINAAGMAAQDIEIKPNIAANENEETADKTG